jgi:hypothetical protein
VGSGRGDGRRGANDPPEGALDAPSDERVAADRALVQRIRRGDAAAFEELAVRYLSLLEHYGRRRGLRRHEAEELAAQALCDVVAELAAQERPRVRTLGARVVERFRERFQAERREREGRIAGARDARADYGDRREAVAVPGTASEGSVRDARGPGWEAPEPSPVVMRLAAVLYDELSEQERALLGWVGEHLPQRTIGFWMGVGHDVARKRLWRLRRRLSETAERFRDALDEGDRRELDRALGRTRRAARTRTTPHADAVMEDPDDA